MTIAFKPNKTNKQTNLTICIYYAMYTFKQSVAKIKCFVLMYYAMDIFGKFK